MSAARTYKTYCATGQHIKGGYFKMEDERLKEVCYRAKQYLTPDSIEITRVTVEVLPNAMDRY